MLPGGRTREHIVHRGTQRLQLPVQRQDFALGQLVRPHHTKWQFQSHERSNEPTTVTSREPPAVVLDPQIGRFTQPDPSGQEKNPYLYAGGDFINNSDPTGLFGWPEVGALVLGRAIGAAAIVVTGRPLVGGVIGGCAVGALAGGINDNGAADMGLACVGGGIAGGLLGGSARLLPK
ncbi:hypothetical protein OG426_09355 [Streptomyces canus]|uniref:RHS repeat-associated core domain-containing protein n=1 Tax=Streptomyces canus TaxID=58343 RepID=UPI0038671678|nr:hypothetical protein OG426_09355 [Streptomyces canus]